MFLLIFKQVVFLFKESYINMTATLNKPDSLLQQTNVKMYGWDKKIKQYLNMFYQPSMFYPNI